MFELSAFPFLALLISSVNQLVLLAQPTAYNENGELTRTDTIGLAAYLRFLRRDVLESRRFQNELHEDFTEAERQKLWSALAEGHACLKKAWRRRRTMAAVTKKEKLRIKALAHGIITKTRASQALYKNCFPNEILVDEYSQRRAAQKKNEPKEESRLASLFKRASGFLGN